ncbi:hypothetical protein SS50377_26026 [Spironucleus salmonicida]|uniref:Uncharacterized protein n=1 Tax=Spironucleus salmonicida TaxID=348837 RepID=V6LM26_9EUKA|nr:hypothetical protein SS50377_26026 [Spironucleus salmonicida]|eukprot:EST44761.1 Hypothetical protein SS50377_15330 [Spironucleus salmonicida]
MRKASTQNDILNPAFVKDRKYHLALATELSSAVLNQQYNSNLPNVGYTDQSMRVSRKLQLANMKSSALETISEESKLFGKLEKRPTYTNIFKTQPAASISDLQSSTLAEDLKAFNFNSSDDEIFGPMPTSPVCDRIPDISKKLSLKEEIQHLTGAQYRGNMIRALSPLQRRIQERKQLRK